MVLTESQIRLGEVLDGLVTRDFTGRGIAYPLYQAARARKESPLIMSTAVRLANELSVGDRVVIATGFPSRSWLIRGLTETDGPAGAAYLARFLEQTTGCVPILLMEESLRRFGEVALRSAGLIVSDIDTAMKSKPGPPRASVAAVVNFPVERGAAVNRIDEFFRVIAPKALIAVEFPGQNQDGRCYNVSGREIPSDLIPKVEELFKSAREHGVLTVGIGDGGNELGMGTIRNTVVAHLENGDIVAPVTGVDELIVACISNWGAYGLGAALSFLRGQPELLRTVSIERITTALANEGAIDGLTAYTDPNNDGTLPSTNAALQEMLHATVSMYVKGWNKG
ncbi:DUF4392 domain-containing protein [Alicyclobacillus curvatus]|jgi:D-glutamate cyclase|nr:DUF4392 domain-containing protein [Alicyclobacillus curvatus]